MAVEGLVRRHGGHSHGSGGDDLDMMSMGTISVLWFPRLYWIFVGSALGAFAAAYVWKQTLLWQRLKAARSSPRGAAKPRNIVSQTFATLTAVTREISNASLPPISAFDIRISQPTVGAFSIAISHIILVIVLCLYALDLSSTSNYEDIAYRCGYVSLAQLPLVFLLAGKNNIIGFLTGSSYERLNWLHRWVSRTLLISITLHMSYWFLDWSPYGDYITYQLKNDHQTKTGFAAWIIYLWIFFSSFAPIRGWSYEIFVLQHFVSMVTFVVVLFLHLPRADWGWLWAPVAIYLFDRTTRAVYAAYINLSIFHPQQKRGGTMRGFWSCRAELTPMSHGVTKVTVRNPPLTWQAGQHAFISLHSIVPGQSHPFTISSLPSDQKLSFLIKARRGGTKQIFERATSIASLTGRDLEAAADTLIPKTIPIAIEGPYGRMRPLRQFDTVILIAGATGATFTIPLLRDLVSHWKDIPICGSTRKWFWNLPDGAVTRRVHFNWAVKSLQQLQLFSDELCGVLVDVESLKKQGRDVDVKITIFVTCDETLTSDFDEKTPLPSTSPAGIRQMSEPSFVSSTSSNDVVSDEKLPFKQQSAGLERIEVREIDSRLESTSSTTSSSSDAEAESTNAAARRRQGRKQEQTLQLKTCQPDDTCCCRTAITSTTSGAEEAADAPNANVVCTCHDDGCSSDAFTSTFTSLAPPHQPPKPFKTSRSPSSQPQPNPHHHTTPLLPPSITHRTGRPAPQNLILSPLEQAIGESAVVVCGPKSMNDEVRREVVRLSDERAVCKGSGAGGIWFWGEGFGY